VKLMDKPLDRKRILCCVPALLLAALLALACCSCAGKATVKPLDPATVGAIDAAVAESMDKHKSPGALVGVWKEDGTVLVKAYGLAEVKPEQLMQEGLSFRIGSVTKTFTGNLILQLVDQGRLSLDDPVAKFVPGIPGGEAITIRMLLNHSSGLFNYGADAGLNEIVMSDPHRVWTPAELVATGVSNPPYFPPGEGCAYSNTNYILLGMIIEKVTGRTYEEELASRITGPLGLGDTYMAKGPYLEGEHAHGYQYDPQAGELFDATDYLDQSIVWAAGGMVSTLEDLRIWGRALAGGQLVSPELREAITTSMLDLPGMTDYFGYPMEYGLGIIDFGGWLGHSGMEVGYSSAMFDLPQEEAVVVVFMNVSDLAEPGMRLFMQVTGILFPEETPW
jgi:D-alanyl-D-alanine carboxypeptidase